MLLSRVTFHGLSLTRNRDIAFCHVMTKRPAKTAKTDGRRTVSKAKASGESKSDAETVLQQPLSLSSMLTDMSHAAIIAPPL